MQQSVWKDVAHVHLRERILETIPGRLRFPVQLCFDAAACGIGAYAASASFFIMLSAFPALLLLFSVMRLTHLTQSDLWVLLEPLLPHALHPLLDSVRTELSGLASPGVISLTAVLAVWSASRGVLGVMTGINVIFHVSENRNYLLRRFICMFYTLLLIVALLVTLALHVFGRVLLAQLTMRFSFLTQAVRLVFVLRFAFSLILLTVVFSLIYHVFPNRRVPFSFCLSGGLFAALGWLGFSSLFSVYVSRSSTYSTFYGSLAAIAFFMLWLQICMAILLFGGVVTQGLMQQRAARRQRPFQ